MVLWLLCRIHDLEMAVERMKQQQETLQRKLKEEAEQKAKLEVGTILASWGAWRWWGGGREGGFVCPFSSSKD